MPRIVDDTPSFIASLAVRRDAADIIARELAALGFDPRAHLDALPDPASPAADDILDIYARAARALDDPWLGLRLGAARGLAWLGPVGKALAAAANVREAVALAARYVELLVHGQRLTVELSGPTCTLRLGMIAGHDPLGVSVVQQSSVLVIANVLDELLGRPDFPRRLRFACPAPRAHGHRTSIERAGRRLDFDARLWSVELPSACLRLPLRATASPTPPDVLLELAAERARLDAQRGLRGQLALALLHHLADAPPLSDVACTLGLAPRTLQARLRALGTSYQAEIDRLRVDVAARYLQRTDEPIALIGARVGFAAPAAFTRFFRAATGRSPRDFRRDRAGS